MKMLSHRKAESKTIEGVTRSLALDVATGYAETQCLYHGNITKI